MIPLYYYSWPPVLWLDWWCHHAAQSGESRNLSMNPPSDPRIPAVPTPAPAAVEKEHDADNRVIPFPFDRVKHRARNEGLSATLIILAPRAI